jgi:acetyl esterase
MNRNIIATVACIFLCALSSPGVPGFTPDRIVTYKTTAAVTNLYLDVFTPPNHQTTNSRPAIIFFHGGAWISGDPTAFHPECEYLASRGLVAISARYRLATEADTNYNGNLPSIAPQKCVQDAKSAIRYVRQHAAELGIDPDRIAASGGSAGGQMAAAAGTLTLYDEPGEDLNISSKPNALVLYNPVFNNGPVNGWQYDVVINYWTTFSPMNNITSNAPPTVVFLGTVDGLIPVSVAEQYKSLMEAAGVRCDLHLYEGMAHSFFNYGYPSYYMTLLQTDEFLVSLGYLDDANSRSAVNKWVTLYGNAGFSGGSAATSSPVTTDASHDCIAANIPPVTLADGGFIKLTGTVTLDAPLASGNFQVGLFDGNNPVVAGNGTNYAGFWAQAPGTSSTAIKYDYEAPQGDVKETFAGTNGTSIIGATTTTGGQMWQGVQILNDNGSLFTDAVLGPAYFPFTAENGKQYRISLDVNLDVYTGATRYLSVGFFKQQPTGSNRHNSSGYGGAFMQFVPNQGLVYAKYNTTSYYSAVATFTNWYTMTILLTCAADGLSYTVDYSCINQGTGVSNYLGRATISKPISEMTYAGISGDPRGQSGFADNFLLTNDNAGSGASTYPFDPAASASFGTIAAAAAAVPASTPIDFTLLILRRGDLLDLSADFTDHGAYRPALNMVNNAASAKYFTNGASTLNFDTAAFMMEGGTSGTYSNIVVTSGKLKSHPIFRECKVEGNNLRLSWSSRDGHIYQLKSSDSLTVPAGAWTTRLSNISATAPTNSRSISIPAAAQQFYYVEEFFFQ